MAALVATTPTAAGTASPGNNVASSDTISAVLLGSFGVLLEVLNGNASPDSMTISDFSKTQAGNNLPSNNYAASVTNATNKIFKIVPSQADPASGNVTVTHSVTSTVTYKLYPLG